MKATKLVFDKTAAVLASPDHPAMKRTLGTALVVAMATIALAACGSSGPSAAPTTTTAPGATTTTAESIAAARAAYEAAVAPLNAALSTFQAEARLWTTSTSNATGAAEAKPAIVAMQRFIATLTRDQWPARATADVHVEIGDLAALAGDLQSIATLTTFNASSWSATTGRDEAELKSAVGLVRHDLGLPPATN